MSKFKKGGGKGKERRKKGKKGGEKEKRSLKIDLIDGFWQGGCLNFGSGRESGEQGGKRTREGTL